MIFCCASVLCWPWIEVFQKLILFLISHKYVFQILRVQSVVRTCENHFQSIAPCEMDVSAGRVNGYI